MNLDCVVVRPGAKLPTRAHDSDAGLDLYAAVAATLPAAGGRVSVPTGIALAVPAGYVGLVCPRSGLALRHGVSVVNAPGVIDPGFRGEVAVLLVNLDPCEDYLIAAGDRIAQLLLCPFTRADPRPVAALDDTARQASGFGSSGR